MVPDLSNWLVRPVILYTELSWETLRLIFFLNYTDFCHELGSYTVTIEGIVCCFEKVQEYRLPKLVRDEIIN